MKNSNLEKFKKTLILSLVCLLALAPAGLSWAQEITPPPEPTPTEAVPTPVAEPSVPPTPAAPTITEALSPTPTPSVTPTEEAVSTSSLPTPTPPPAAAAADDKAGETAVITEEATNSVVLVTSGNTNELTGEEDSVAATESASISQTESESTKRENQAQVDNSLNQVTETGGNSASNNVGDSRVESGKANTSGTVITALNTNLSGVAFTEYNVAGEQAGDLILDFSQNSLADSDSSLVKRVEESESFQNNEAVLENTLVLSSNSGDNQANLNTGGDSTVQTGDASVAATVLTFLNNNLAGNVSLGVVNIFGTLVGDIILPKEAMETQTATAVNEETVGINFQNNEAVIENNLILQADTGGNEGRDNTGGATEIKTGEASVDAQTVNVVNSNLAGGQLVAGFNK